MLVWRSLTPKEIQVFLQDKEAVAGVARSFLQYAEFRQGF